MKLPNFFDFAPLVDLKRKMSIPDNVYGSFEHSAPQSRLTEEELTKLSSGEGLDVYFDALTVLDDGTLSYKNTRILLYIRDVSIYGKGPPRYHISNCNTLQEMIARGRFERYVIATENSGRFKINFITNGNARSEKRVLSVCQNCLAKLQFDGFRYDMNRSQRGEIVRQFTPDRFFRMYPKSLHGRVPKHNDANSPLNNYTKDWSTHSFKVRSAANWTCSHCKKDFSAPDMRKFLDVHHLDAQKWNNDSKNLFVVCIKCHAEQPNHSHLKSDPRYTAYIREHHRNR